MSLAPDRHDLAMQAVLVELAKLRRQFIALPDAASTALADAQLAGDVAFDADREGYTYYDPDLRAYRHIRVVWVGDSLAITNNPVGSPTGASMEASRMSAELPVVVTDQVLQCPRCKNNPGFLHHDSVAVFDRGEDAKRVTVAVVKATGVKRGELDNNLSGNPSDRRDGIRIEFWCETCGARPVLNLAQHKGETRAYWTIPEKPSNSDLMQLLE